jgi:hypothetical protein
MGSAPALGCTRAYERSIESDDWMEPESSSEMETKWELMGEALRLHLPRDSAPADTLPPGTEPTPEAGVAGG